MSDRVIIFDSHIGSRSIEPSMLRQMAGRAGRKHGGVGYVDYIVSPGEEKTIKDLLEEKSSYLVSSVLEDTADIAFHVIAEIRNKRIYDKTSLEKWFSRSFYSYTKGVKVNLDEVVEFLKDCEAIDDNFGVKPIGDIAVNFYFNSLSIQEWALNFDEIFANDVENNDAAIAWALGSISANSKYCKIHPLLEECRDEVSSCSLYFEDKYMSWISIWWAIFSGRPKMGFDSEAFGFIEDFSRIYHVLKSLDIQLKHWNKLDFFDKLSKRVQKGIPSHLVELCELKGIGKGYAMQLYELGIKTVEDLKEKRDNLEWLENPRLVSVVNSLLEEFDNERKTTG